MGQAAKRPWSRPSAYTAEAARLWRSRQDYTRTSDWAWSLYNRLLNSRIGRPWPLRHHVRAVHLRGVPDAFHLRLGTTDWPVLEELWVNKGYDCVFNEPIGPVRNIVDLGANIGMSIRLWQAHFPDANIVAVEPAAGNLNICRLNARAGNVPDGKLQLVHACAVGTPRTVYLDDRRGEWSTTMRDQPVGDGAESIQGLTTESLCDRLGAGVEIDLLKCDVEGAEREIFADCRSWIHRVRNILIELHDPYTKDQFMADLKNNGSRRFSTTVLEIGSGIVELMLVGES
jgi:FkbM family methyltransferase